MSGMGFSRCRVAIVLAGLLGTTIVSGAAPKERVRLDVALAHPVMLAEDDSGPAYLRVALTGNEWNRSDRRAPVNVAIVLDRSGSMRGEKIREAKRAAIMAVEQLNDEDIVSVVTYESTVHVLVPATRASDRAAIREAIESITAGGSTALFAGVSKGAAELRKFLERDRVNRIILLSDGLANVGPSTPGQLGDLGASLAREGIAVTTMGLGLHYNEDLMTQLAYRSDGNHFFVENAEDLTLAWATEFGDVLSVVAQNVKIEIRFPSGVRPVRVLGREASIDGQTLRAALNHIYAGQTKYLLVEVDVPPGQAGGVVTVAGVDASYTDVSGSPRTAREDASVTFTDSPSRVQANTRADVMVAVVSQIAAEQNELATALRDEGRLDEARRTFLENRAYLEANALRYDDKGLARDAQTQELAAENLEEEQWNRTRKKQLEYQLKTKQQGAYSEKKKD